MTAYVLRPIKEELQSAALKKIIKAQRAYSNYTSRLQPPTQQHIPKKNLNRKGDVGKKTLK